MTELEVARSMLLQAVRGVPATYPVAKELRDWARTNGQYLFGLKATQAKKLSWTGFKRALEAGQMRADEPAGVLRLAGELSRLLGLDAFDTAVVEVALAIDRLRYPSQIAKLLARFNYDLPALIGEAAGAEPQDAERRVRLNPLVRSGLIQFRKDWGGRITMDLRWTLENLIDRQPESAEEIVALLVGPPQRAALPFDAFRHIEDADFLRRLLTGARREQATGVNVLIHGPPGTGKTEFARTLAAEAGLTLHGVGEADDSGEEPTRWDRMAALQMGQRLLAGQGGAALLFDEMEDLIGDTQPSENDWYRARQGSKVFVNRLLETNPVPVIWTTNAIGNIDPAILRRMSFVLRLDRPSRDTALRMLGHIAGEEGVEPGEELSRLVESVPESASVLRVAARSGRLAGEADGGARPAKALARALTRGELPLAGPGEVDFALYEADLPIDTLFETMRQAGHADISLLLTGPPGTGKTALAHQLARTLDRQLIIKRTSDLLSMWVGETEARIARAFAEARRCGGVLLFDEADSLLFDRSTARTSWEVSQVNELLTWLEGHPYPVVAATNHAARLDPATLRRFTFKLELHALSAERAARAFGRFFSRESPPSLAAVGNLTPGDFAVVARQLRHAPASSAEEIVERLRAEAAAKPGTSARIGF